MRTSPSSRFSNGGGDAANRTFKRWSLWPAPLPRSSADAYAQRSYSTLATTSRDTKRRRKPYGRLTVTLPTFVIIALRELVKDSEYSVSELLTGWLLKSLSVKDLEKIAARSPEFKQTARAWIKWLGDLPSNQG